MTGKSRSAPFKITSIPRLELQGALLAAWIDLAVRSELDFILGQGHLLVRLNDDAELCQEREPVIPNEIKELMHPDQWRHCPGTKSSIGVHTLRRVAWLLKFLDWIKWRVPRKSDPKAINVHKTFNYDDLERAKKRFVAVAQKSNFSYDVRNLKEGKQMKASSKVIKLKPIMKDGEVMRVGGRISKAPISADAMNPMILPKRHHISTILIQNIHETNGHRSIEQVLSRLREQFLIAECQRSNQESP